MNKYNQYELRFLQVLVSKQRLMEIYGEQFSIWQDEIFFRGTMVIGRPDDKFEWVKGIIDPDERIQLDDS